LGEKREAWIVDYVDGQGNRHIKTFDRKKEADEYRATVKVDIRRGVHTASKATVSEAGQKWLADAHDRLEPATVATYRQHRELHICPFIGEVKLAQLTVPVMRDFMDRLRAEKRSPGMIKRVIGDFGSILSDAQERGLVAQNVVRSLSRRRKGKAEHRDKRKL